MTQSAAVAVRRREPPTAKRSIYFYRLDGGSDESGVPRPVDLQPAFEALDTLPFSAESGRYLPQQDGSHLCAWVDDPSDHGLRFRLATIRRTGLPQSESGGMLNDLLLSDEEGLCESIHLCVYPTGIVGAEFNFYGPRPGRLPLYLNHAVGHACPEFSVEALLRHDMEQLLRQKSGVRALTIRIRRPYISVVEGAEKSLGAALRAAEAGSGAECIGIILQPEPYQRHSLNPAILTALRRLIGRDDLRENALELRATLLGNSSSSGQEINLLEDKLISKKTILKLGDRSRVLDKDDAYAKIDEAYRELHKDLLSAASVSL